MDSYPEEWIDGVKPLIFAVDSVFSNDSSPAASINQKSKAFEAFYKYISSKTPQQPKTEKAPVPSDPLSDMLSSDPSIAVAAAIKTLPSFTMRSSKPKHTNPDFFAHARVVPVSHRHAFPPSKDPHGNQNAVAKLNSSLYSARNLQTPPNTGAPNPISPFNAILAKNPVQGILPEGWIEKHTHALPSTLLLVTTLSLTTSAYEQAQLEQYLATTIEHITASCAKKRECPIHIVCLVERSSSGSIPTMKEMTIEQERIGSIRAVCRLSTGAVSALHYYHDNDSKNTIFVQDHFQKLQQAVESESMLYYLTQVRRCKRKHSNLYHEKFVDLLPYAARYCIKIAIFYEFQGCVDTERGQKSIRYWKEAYRNVTDYYKYLQNKCATGTKTKFKVETESYISKVTMSDDDALTAMTDPRPTNEVEISSSIPPPPPDTIPASVSDDGVEVALTYSPNSGNHKLSIENNENQEEEFVPNTYNHDESNVVEDGLQTTMSPSPSIDVLLHSPDMIQQCRAVADFLNIKLLLNNYATEIKILAENGNDTSEKNKEKGNSFNTLADQINLHSQLFLSRPNSLQRNKAKNIIDVEWHFLSFVARQRLTLAEFLSKYPITSNLNITLDSEVASICNPFFQYISCGEAYLLLNSYTSRLDKEQVLNETMNSDISDAMQRYVGSYCKQDVEILWEEQLKEDKLGKAFQYLNRSVDLVSEEKCAPSTHAFLGRVYYLMGGILMKQKKYDSALEYLTKVSSMVNRFSSLKLAVQRSISKCQSMINANIGSKDALSQIFDCDTNTYLTKTELKTLFHATNRDGDLSDTDRTIEQMKRPLEYCLSFPFGISATEGDSVVANLHLYSNMPFRIDIVDIDLDLNVGKVKCNEKNISLHCNQKRVLECEVVIPHGSLDAADAKILERQHVKKTRPTTFGLTKIGGAVFSSHSGPKPSGGLVVCCLSATLKITKITAPTYSEDPITITLPNVHRGSFPSDTGNNNGETKRVSLDEDNFIYSAWSRPNCFSMGRGPRCLRILRAQALMRVIDLTSEEVNNKAMEGTINRYLLKLESDQFEKCLNVRMRVSCASWLDTDIDDDNSDDQESQKEKSIPSRLPLIVTNLPTSRKSVHIKELPGWREMGRDGEERIDEWIELKDCIQRGSCILANVDLYRPLSSTQQASDFNCKTRFTVDIAYDQIRLDQLEEKQEPTQVISTYQNTVTWCCPFSAKFGILPTKGSSLPSGSRHPANFVGNDELSAERKSVLSGNFVQVSCTVSSHDASNNLSVQIKDVKFEAPSGSNVCDVTLIGSNNLTSEDRKILFEPKSKSFFEQLRNGSKLKIGYTVRPSMNVDHISKSESPQAVSTPLGAISINWSPLELLHSLDIDSSHISSEYKGVHGPLPLQNLPRLILNGPNIYVEETPFKASFNITPSIPRVSTPFDVKYKVVNKSDLQQRIRVSMVENEDNSNSMLVSGIINGDILLGPQEDIILGYTLLVTESGKISLPTLEVVSLRYNTWIVKSSQQDTIYVLP